MTTEIKYQDLLESIPCNLCGATDFTVTYPADDSKTHTQNLESVFRSSGDDILVDQLVQCCQCGLQYLNPRLKESVILAGYQNGEDELFVSQAAAREETFRRCWKRISHYHPQPGKILDVGTASGAFLKVAKDNQWQIAGCEPNDWLTQWCRKNYGLEIFAGTIFDMGLASGSFDVVSLWDVLEHTADPKKVIKECARVLRKDGLLVVNYPDIASMVSKLMGRKWVFLLSIHLYYFTPKTIKNLLSKTGFTILEIRPHWQSLELDYIFLRMRAYIPWIADLGRGIAKYLHIEKMNIPYWMGQTLVLARKNEST